MQRDPPAAHPPVEQLNALTSLRFFAAIQVMMFHYLQWLTDGIPPPGIVRIGYSGVTFFFILSGFILAHNYYQTDFSVRDNVHRFFSARLSRIYPVLLFSLACSLPFALAYWLKIPAGPLKAITATSVVLAPLGLQAWVPGAASFLNFPSWSISTEFFFYLMFPLLLWRVKRRPRLWLGLTFGMWALACATCFAAWGRIAPGASIIAEFDETAPKLVAQAIKYFPLGRLPEFMLGIVLYVFWRSQRGTLRPPPAMLAFLGGALVLLTYRTAIPDILMHNGLTAIAWAPLILSAAGMRTGVLTHPVTVYLGRISFALYLLHIPVLDAFKAVNRHVMGGALTETPMLAIVGCTSLAIALAALVYELVEEPMRRPVMGRAMRWWRHRELRTLGAPPVAPPLAGRRERAPASGASSAAEHGRH